MDIGASIRRLAPLAVGAGGTVVAGGVLGWGMTRFAGEAEGGMLAAGVGSLASTPLATGGLSGVAAGMIMDRTYGAGFAPVLGPLVLIPAGIAGAVLGSRIARGQLEAGHADEYASSLEMIDETMRETQQAFRDAGASERVLDRVPERYDRSYFNASYHPPLGPFGDRIVVGRHPDSGDPFASRDVIAHEFTHKVVHAYAPKLLGRVPIGDGDARSIHESLADTMAMVVDGDDWLVGEDSVPGGIRSFSHPEVRGSYHGGEETPAPITRSELDGDEEHLGAGVGNKAAWRIGDALGRDVMAKVYVAALERRELGRGATYADLARVVRAAADDLYGSGSREAQVVDDAWRQAGY